MTKPRYETTYSVHPQRSRGCDRTDAEKTELFDQYVEKTVPYFDKVIESGGTPWFASDDAGSPETPDEGHAPAVSRRRELFDRRYQRPEPPASLPEAHSLRDINSLHQFYPDAPNLWRTHRF